MESLKNRILAKRRSQRGSAFAETLFVLPVIILLLFGLADFSLVFHDYLVASNAARSAVRASSLSAIPCVPNTQVQAGVQRATTMLQQVQTVQNITISHAELNNGDLCARGLIGASITVRKNLTFLSTFTSVLAFPPVQFTVRAFAMNENGN
jgi:hypothetical protein